VFLAGVPFKRNISLSLGMPAKLEDVSTARKVEETNNINVKELANTLFLLNCVELTTFL
tara:strand:+ start:2809 stop:2985 length:177 start_codon:yes stop_codon:yes gene_type:complete